MLKLLNDEYVFPDVAKRIRRPPSGKPIYILTSPEYVFRGRRTGL